MLDRILNLFGWAGGFMIGWSISQPLFSKVQSGIISIRHGREQ